MQLVTMAVAMGMPRRLGLGLAHLSSLYLATAIAWLLLTFLHAPPLAGAQPLPWQLCDDTARNYTEGSAYQANIRVLANGIPKNASSSPGLFAKGAAGTPPDVVYALALCRGDTTNASSCASCVDAAFRNAQQLCAYNRRATMFDDPCILRYSDQDFLAYVTDNSGLYIAWNARNVSQPEVDPLEAAVLRLAMATADDAAADPVRRFGSREEVFNGTYPKLYSLAQCTPDMTATECRRCLDGLNVGFTPQYFPGHPGGRVFGVRCNFRFETYSFFSRPPLGPSPAPAPLGNTEKETHKISTVLVVIIPVLIVAAPLAIFIAWFYLWRRRRPAANTLQPTDSASGDDIHNIDSLLLDLSTLKLATDDFAEHRRLGEGGFGVVYKVSVPPYVLLLWTGICLVGNGYA